MAGHCSLEIAGDMDYRLRVYIEDNRLETYLCLRSASWFLARSITLITSRATSG